MNEEIKERLEQIRRGELPDGYKRTKAGIIPEVWKVRQFADVFQFISNNSYSRALMTDSGGEIRNIHYGDVLIKYHAVIDCAANDLPFLTNSEKIRQDMFLKSGDIIIADTAEDLTAGKAVEITNVGNHQVVSGLHTMACRPAENLFAPKWLGYYMDSAVYHSQLIPLICGAKVSSISKGEIINTVIAIPPLTAQQRIADILSAQDSVIELKERLVTEKLRQKKYLMQQLLTGKQRLPEFHRKWKEKQLGDIFDTFSGGTPNRKCPEYFHGDIPWIKSGELNQGNIYFTEERITKEGLENSSAKMVSKNTLLIAMYGATAGVMAFTRIDAAINQAILAFVPKTPIDILFIKESISNQIDMAINQLTQGGQPNFNASIIQSLSIRIPELAEQRKISEIFSCANREIELLRASLEQEKRKKKALSQLLLTGIVRV